MSSFAVKEPCQFRAPFQIIIEITQKNLRESFRNFIANMFREAGRFFANFRFPFLKDLPGKFSAGEKLAAFCNAKEQSELCNKAQVIGSRKLCSRRPPFFCLLFHPRKCEKLLRS